MAANDSGDQSDEEGFMVLTEVGNLPYPDYHFIKRNFIGAVRSRNSVTIRFKLQDAIYRDKWRVTDISFDIEPLNIHTLKYLRIWGAKV
jgi:hypothetical protein